MFFVIMTVGAVIAVFNVCLPGVDSSEVFATFAALIPY